MEAQIKKKEKQVFTKAYNIERDARNRRFNVARRSDGHMRTGPHLRLLLFDINPALTP
jgi:hypothetical protein